MTRPPAAASASARTPLAQPQGSEGCPGEIAFQPPHGHPPGRIAGSACSSVAHPPRRLLVGPKTAVIEMRDKVADPPLGR